jgi:hypothetical protein
MFFKLRAGLARTKIAAGLVTLSIVGLPAQVRADERGAFVEAYKCSLVAHLAEIVTPKVEAWEQGRFVVVGGSADLHGYVQCLFYPKDVQVLCEAASGLWSAPPGASKHLLLSAPAIAAIARLGYGTDIDDGNYQLMLETHGKPDLEAIADLMLKTLYDGYGVRSRTPLMVSSPLDNEPLLPCPQVS